MINENNHCHARLSRLVGRCLFYLSSNQHGSPHGDIDCYVVVVERLKRISDGAITEREVDAPIFNGYDGPHIWYWEEGNMECDCNRAKAFGEESPCSCLERRYLLNLINPYDGTILYREFTDGDVVAPNSQLDRSTAT